MVEGRAGGGPLVLPRTSTSSVPFYFRYNVRA